MKSSKSFSGSTAVTHDLFLLDDAAQGLGARYQGRPVGSFGDVGLFSFDKGKNITTLQGGVLVANPGAFADALDEAMKRHVAAVPSARLSTLLKLPAYALLLRPQLYGVVRHLPLGLGLTPWETDFPIARFSRTLAGLAMVQLERLTEINGTRIRNATGLTESLAGLRGVTTPRVLPGAEPVYPRYPVLVDAAARTDLIAALERAGIGATASYPRALIDVPEVIPRLPADQKATPGAREVANRILTLPTHGYSPADLGPRVASVVARHG